MNFYLLKKWVFENKEKTTLYCMYLFLTLFFIFQQSLTVSWDFNVYKLNAGSWVFGDGYNEVGRPPLASVIFLFTNLFGSLSDYLFVILISTLFLYAIIEFSKTAELSPLILYGLFFTPFAISNSVFAGTELLSVSLVLLGVTFILRNNYFSGFFLALAALSRYSLLTIFPLLLFHNHPKTILKSFILYCITFVPWFVYNYLSFGNFFTSIADQYALNVLFRYSMPVIPLHFLIVLGPLLFLMLPGIRVLFTKKRKIDFIFLFLFLFTVYGYFTTPYKIDRYLFLLILPAAYYSYLFIKNFKHSRLVVVGIFIISFIVAVGLFIPEIDRGLRYEAASSLLEGRESCNIKSNMWVHLNVYGITTFPPPMESNVEKELNEGLILVMFNGIPPFYEGIDDYLNYSDSNVNIYGDKCVEGKNIFLHTKERKEAYPELNINPCFIIFDSFSLAEKTCNLINGEGFKKDENRNIHKFH